MLINRQDWPPTGPHRALLDFFDQIHREHGCKSFDRLSTDMGRVSRAPGLAASRIHAILRGRSLPTSAEQTRLIVLAMIGNDEPPAAAEAGKAARLFVEAEQAHRDAQLVSAAADPPEPTDVGDPAATDAEVDAESVAADPGGGRPPPQAEPQQGRPRTRALALAGAAALLLAVVVGVLLLWPTATGTDVGVAAEGISCSPRPDAAVRISAISADDGRAGIATYNTITVEVSRENRTGHTYWLLAHVFEVGETGPYIAKDQVFDDIGTRTYALQLDSQVNSVREIFIVEADPVGTAMLRWNNSLPMDGSADRDMVRVNRPPAPVVSATCRVTKTRDHA